MKKFTVKNSERLQKLENKAKDNFFKVNNFSVLDHLDNASEKEEYCILMSRILKDFEPSTNGEG